MVSQERAAATIVDLPPSVRKSEIYLPVLRILTTLLAYRSFFARQDEDEVLAAIQTGLHRWPVAGKSCIKALTLALLELPQSMTKLLPATLLKVSQMMSTAMAASNLEFLATLAGLPMLRVNFTDADLKRVFVIALQYINTSFNAQHELAAFVVRLAYQVLLAWFVGLKLAERRKYVPFIIHYLLLGGESSKTLDENVELVLDLLIHHSFADCFPKPDDSTNKLTKTQQGQSRVWSQGNSLLTVQVADQPGWAHVTIRRPTGVISFNIMLENRLKVEVTFQLPLSVQVALQRARSARDDMFSSPTTSTGDMSSAISAIRSCEEQASIDPSFILSQFISYPNLLSRDSLIQLPDNETTKRSLSVLDRTPVIDLHKIGVVYVGPAQYTEKEILANNRGSRFYGHFLQTLGTFVTLRGCRQVYTGGLDTSEDLDGTHAIYCQDDLSQTIFHCTTMMPNNPHDPLGTAKKRHIGNDFVTIVWNESGKEYAFDTIPGQFNFVNIIIEAAGSLGSELIESAQDSVNTRGVTGEVRASPSPPSYARQFFKVWTRTRADMPDIGLFAEPKIVSAVSLVPFVRQAAMHANILSQLFQNAGNIDQHPSNARERLRQIKQIKVRAEMHKVGSAETTGGPSKSTESTPSRSQATSAHKLFKKQASGNLPGGSASGAGGLDSLPAFAEWETILDFTRFA
ncbi:hypothetical protein DFS34DRAFT_713786 [Phlyctochytrium arcticum]|nr:hypothetical protein DFS34DRAFT_713786 [Phlyctochytrium arcticum]